MRLFVAVEAPDAWREAAAAVQRALPAEVREHARLVDLANMHVTLRFIGEVEEADVPALESALAEALPPVEVELTLGSVGTFGQPARTSVVWLGVAGDLEGLSALARRADAAVDAALGLEPETRRYFPHLTLARVRNGVPAAARRAIAEWAREVPAPPPHHFVAREALLVRSRLGGEGARYQVLGRYGLRPGCNGWVTNSACEGRHDVDCLPRRGVASASVRGRVILPWRS
jgi:RNA 2',3'-cyclic 3'-phosphodiesterase